MSLSKTEANTLAYRLRALRPVPPVTESKGPQATLNRAQRRLWADMVNAFTGSGAIATSQIREWREQAGWEAEHDRQAQS